MRPHPLMPECRNTPYSRVSGAGCYATDCRATSYYNKGIEKRIYAILNQLPWTLRPEIPPVSKPKGLVLHLGGFGS